MKIVLPPQVLEKVSLEDVMNDMYLRYYFFDQRKTSKPKLDEDGGLSVPPSKIDVYFLYKIRERVAALCGFGEERISVSASVPSETVDIVYSE